MVDKMTRYTSLDRTFFLFHCFCVYLPGKVLFMGIGERVKPWLLQEIHTLTRTQDLLCISQTLLSSRHVSWGQFLYSVYISQPFPLACLIGWN